MTSITASDVGFALGIIGIISVIFSVYNKFHKPQEELETKQVGIEKDVANKATLLAQKEMENKAALLDQQVKLERESNEKKFNDFGKRLEDAFLLAANHTKTVDTKVDTLSTLVTGMNLNMTNKLTELATIIAERLPKG